MRRATGLLILLAGAARAAPPPPAPPPPAMGQDPVSPADPGAASTDLTRELSPEDPLRSVVDSLTRLDAAYPDVTSIDVLGTSRDGRPILAATVATGASPGIALVADLRDDPQAGQAAVRELVARWLALSAEPEARSAGGSVVVAIPVPDPDRFSAPGPTAGRPTDLDQNFPMRWQPWSGGRSGPWPLSEPESRALAEGLIAREGLSVLLVVGGEGLEPDDARVDPATRALLERSPSGRLSAAAPEPGSLAAFAAERLGLACLRLDGEADHLAALQELAALLPRLVAGEPRVEPLGSGLWQLEIDLRNTGGLPTATPAALLQHAADGGRASVDGARLIAAALRAEAAGFALAESRAGVVALGPLGPGRRQSLRLVLAAESQAIVRVRVETSRASGVELSVPLP